MSTASRLSALVLVAGLLGGAVGCAAMDKPAWLETKATNDAEANFYTEVVHEGRIYVLGKSATLASFQQTHDLPFRQTFIGAGPKGETVVLEAEAKEVTLQARLRRAWEAKHGPLS